MRDVLVYVSGPYTGKDAAATGQNVLVAQRIGGMLIKAGYSVIVPHLFHHLECRDEVMYQTWLDVDLELLSRCDILVRIEGASPGADLEERTAVEEFGLEVVRVPPDVDRQLLEGLLIAAAEMLKSRW